MNRFLDFIFGLSGDGQSLGFGSENAQVSFVHPIAAWVGAIVAVLVIGAVWWSYRALPGNRVSRGMMALVRALLVCLLFALALGPMIEQSTIRTEQDWALVLLDRSGSTQTRDAIGDAAGTTESGSMLVTRHEQLREMLEGSGSSWESLALEKQVVWMGFDERSQTIARGEVPGIDQLGTTESSSTDLNGAILAALGEAAARPISSIVIASDGRSFTPIDPDLMNTLKAAQIPVYAIALGNDAPVRDLGIARVEYPQAVFADDLVPVRVQLSSSSIPLNEIEQGRWRIDLIDRTTNAVLDSTPIRSTNLETEAGELVTLSFTPEEDGNRDLGVVIVDEGRSVDQGFETDLNSSNDESSFSLRVVDRAMRVLYIDGYPRWEQRYLKNLLLREKSIASSSMLLASSRSYIQDGDELISSIPSTFEEWEPFDVVILGDVRRELFSEAQVESLVEHVTRRGAGVMWIAGQSATPSSWLDSPLGSLLPVRSDAGGSQNIVRAWDTPITMVSTQEAVRIGVLGLNDERDGWSTRLSDPSTGWSKLQWALELDETSFKPGVSVLATARSVDGAREAPIITTMRYGAGRSVFVGTDEIWRWRYGRGEDLPERFWLPMIRSLGRGTVDRRGSPASLTLTPTNPSPGNPTQITLRVFDQQRVDQLGEEIIAQVRSTVGIEDPIEITLGGTGDTRSGTWIPDQPGAYSVSLIGLDLEMSQVVGQALVLDESDEQRMLDTDHAFLERLAQETNGAMIPPQEFSTIPQLMPNRSRTITTPPKQVTLWDRPIVLLVLVLLLSTEWIGRRVMRLA
jgi:hypothetical protein